MKSFLNKNNPKLIITLLSILIVVLLTAGQSPFDWIMANRITVKNNAELNGRLPGRFMQVFVPGETANIKDATGVVSTTRTITSGFASMFYPRDLVLTATSATTRTGGSLIVRGTDAYGRPIIESLTMATSPTTDTITTTKAYSKLSSIEWPAQTQTITWTVSVGKKLASPVPLQTVGDVMAVRISGTLTSTFTVNDDEDTISVPGLTTSQDTYLMVKQ